MKRYTLLASCLFFTMACAHTNQDTVTDRNILSTLAQGVTDAINAVTATIASYLYKPEPNPYTGDSATMRYSATDELCAQEQAFLTTRLPLVQAQLEQMLGISLAGKRVPRIAFCFSGGGFRAMLLTLGFLSGAQKIGLLNSATYMAGLSGSTWAIAPWIASGKSLNTYQQELPAKIENGLQKITDPSDLATVMNVLVGKIANDQKLSSVDIYGSLLANTLLTDLGSNRFTVGLSDSHITVTSGAYPMPIYTSAITDVEPYEWMEFTPFEVGSGYLHCYIPTWAYGSKFENSVALKTAPEQALGYCIGIFGSAYDVDTQDLVRLESSSIISTITSLPTELQPLAQDALNDIANSSFGQDRFFPSELCNFSYNCSNSPLCTTQDLTLVDGGLAFNLPFPPLMRAERQIDIIVVCDASADIIGAPELAAACAYMQRKGLPFPPIDCTQAGSNIISVFSDETNPHCPVVVYIPRIKNPVYSTTFDPEVCVATGYCDTYNFDYSADEVAQLSGLAEFAVVQNAAIIQQVISNVVARG